MSETIALQSISVVTVWLLGLSMGLTACTVTCLPFMGTWIIGRNQNLVSAWQDTCGFVSGRILAYSILGALAGVAGKWLATSLEGGIGHVVIGASAIFAGWWLFTTRDQHTPCGIKRKWGEVSPFAIGFSLSLTPCVPLASLLAVCAQANTASTGLAYGVAFGLGAALTPMLILLPLLGSFGQRLRDNRPWLGKWIRRGAGFVLIVIGLRRLLFVL